MTGILADEAERGRPPPKDLWAIRRGSNWLEWVEILVHDETGATRIEANWGGDGSHYSVLRFWTRDQANGCAMLVGGKAVKAKAQRHG